MLLIYKKNSSIYNKRNPWKRYKRWLQRYAFTKRLHAKYQQIKYIPDIFSRWNYPQEASLIRTAASIEMNWNGTKHVCIYTALRKATKIKITFITHERALKNFCLKYFCEQSIHRLHFLFQSHFKIECSTKNSRFLFVSCYPICRVCHFASLIQCISWILHNLLVNWDELDYEMEPEGNSCLALFSTYASLWFNIQHFYNCFHFVAWKIW